MFWLGADSPLFAKANKKLKKENTWEWCIWKTSIWKENRALSKLGHHCYSPHVKTSVTGLALWISKHAWDRDVSVAQVQGKSNSDMIFHSASWENLTYWSREMTPTQHWACALKTCDNLVFQTWISCWFYIIKVQEPNLILWKFYIRNFKDKWRQWKFHSKLKTMWVDFLLPSKPKLSLVIYHTCFEWNVRV
jgi:hypothetical protein